MGMFNTFDQVAKHYAETKPIRGRTEDIRPLGQRRYWWNRIHKVSDTKYLLMDGNWAYWGAGGNNPEGTYQNVCPITWERKPDGDYITIRNNLNGGSSVSRYQFIDRYLPQGMRFDWGSNGKHFVHQRNKDGTWKEFYLPKSQGSYDHNTKIFTSIKDNTLVFKDINPDGFERVSDLLPMQTRRIDKDLDRSYAPKVRELWDWMQIVLPVLGETLNSNRHEYAETLTGGGWYGYWTKQVGSEVVRGLLEDEQHDKRMAFAVCIANEMNALEQGRFQPKANSFKMFRDLVRKTGNFYLIDMV